MSNSYVTISEETVEGDYRFTAVLLKLGNALVAFFNEGESTKLGTLAVAMPQFEGKTYISSILLGERNPILTKILAERLSSASSEIALVSTNLPVIEKAETSAAIFKLVQKLLEKARLK